MTGTTLEQEVIGVIQACRGLIPDSQLDEMVDLANHAEWGIALENLCTQLDEHHAILDEVTLARIEQLGTRMKLAPDYWLRLKRSPFRD